DIDQFLHQRVQFAGGHGGLYPLPRRAQQRRVMGQRAPEVVDVVGLPLFTDVVEGGEGLGPRLIVAQQGNGRHQTTAITRAGPPVPPLCLGAPMKTVAPFAGSWSSPARHSMPKRPPGSQLLCTAKSAELPGSSDRLSTPMQATSSPASMS